MKIFLFVFEILLLTSLLCFFDIKYFLKDKNKKSITKTIFKDTFLLNLLVPAINGSIFRIEDIFNPLKHNYGFIFIVLGVSVAVGGIYLLIKYLVNRYFTLEDAHLKKKGASITLYILSIIFVFIGLFFITITVWGKRTYNDTPIDAIIVTLFSPTKGTDFKIYQSYIESALLITIALTYVYALMFYKKITVKFVRKGEEKVLLREKLIRTLNICLASLLMVGGITYACVRFNVGQLIIAYTQDSPFIEENYYNPRNIKLDFPNEKRNLIHIYLESIENSFFDKANGGHMDKNLMPNLLELSKEGYSFSHLGKDEGRGGPLEAYGATWSVASMVNQFFGIPMKVPTRRNSYGKSGEFFPGAVGIGDILHQMGYEQTMMIGADADFGGLTYMFEDHGNFKIMDHKYALENHMLPSDKYNVNWGYEDEKLYKFAKDEITRLYSTGKPFHFLMENADTHFPGFHFEGDTPVFGSAKSKNYGKTIEFSEKHVVEFIRWIMAQPFYDNTTIIIIGDHLSMDKKFFWDNDFEGFTRTTYNLILNPINTVNLKDDKLFYNRKWGTFDMMPTILASIGVKIDGDRLGIGTNLFSGLPTVFEQNGTKEVNHLLIRKSEYYNKNLLIGKLDYTGDNLNIYKLENN